MSRPFSFFLIALFAGAVLAGESATYRNPILPGFNPDPSICRVGEDYYLVTSTFEYFPGLPIYHSKDLVNWRLIGHAMSDPEHLDLDGLVDNKGLFAPAIRHHEGTFYISCTVVRGKGNYLSTSTTGNFVVTATNPAGPWSEPHENSAPGIDPQLFFDDDGKVYYIGPDTNSVRSAAFDWFEYQPQPIPSQ